MPVDRTATAQRLLAQELDKLSEHERLIVESFIKRGRVARNVAHEFEEQLTLGSGSLIASRSSSVRGASSLFKAGCSRCGLP